MLTMATNKTWIKALESKLNGIQDGIHSMELEVINKLQQREDTISSLFDALLYSRESFNHHNSEWEYLSHTNWTNHDDSQVVFSSKIVKLEFPWYSSDDLIEWFNLIE